MHKITIRKFILFFVAVITISIAAFSNTHFLHFDLNRVIVGNLYPIVWKKYGSVAPHGLTWAPDSASPVKMYPIVMHNESRLRRSVSTLQDKGYQLRSNPTLKLQKGIQWGHNPQSDKNWHFKLNAWDMLVPFFQLYEETGQNQWLATPAIVIEDWIDYNLIEGHSNHFKWYDMSTGLRAVQLALLLQSDMFSTLSSETQKKFIYTVNVHIDVLQKKALLSQGNHGLFQVVGLASLCRVASMNQACLEANVFARENFDLLIKKQFSSEGIHLEHSSQYHLWAIQILNRIKTLELFSHENFDILELAKLNAKWFFHPDGNLTLFGDSELRPLSNYTRILPNNESPAFAAMETSPDSRYALFPNSGYAFYRDNGIGKAEKGEGNYLAISAGFHSRVHKQRDDLSFEWSNNGERIIVDSGKYSYDSDPISRFFRSRFAHNTVTIDDEKPFLPFYSAYGSAVVGGAIQQNMFWTHLKQDRSEFNTTHTRLIVFHPSKWLLIYDHLDSNKIRTFRQWFHFNYGLELINESLKLQVGSQEGEFGATVKHFSSGDFGIEEFFGNQRDPIQGWVSENYKNKRARNSIAFTARGKSLSMATVFFVSKTPDEIDNYEFTLNMEDDDATFELCWKDKGNFDGVSFRANHVNSISSCAFQTGGVR